MNTTGNGFQDGPPDRDSEMCDDVISWPQPSHAHGSELGTQSIRSTLISASTNAPATRYGIDVSLSHPRSAAAAAGGTDDAPRSLGRVASSEPIIRATQYSHTFSLTLWTTGQASLVTSAVAGLPICELSRCPEDEYLRARHGLCDRNP